MRNGSADLALQSGLYRQYLAPNEGAFLDFLKAKRAEVDGAFEARKAEAVEIGTSPRLPGEQDILNYPQGYCLEITSRVSRKVEENMPDYLREFIDAGGVFEKRWGILKTDHQGTVFQNAIHVGTKIFDVAHEETSLGETCPVAAYAVNDPRYRNIQSLEEYAKIRETYQNFRAYSSFGLFGILAPFAVPVIFEREGGWTGYSDEISTMELGIRTDFRATKEFLANSAYATHALPEETAESLRFCMKRVLEEDAEYDDPNLAALSMRIRQMRKCFSFEPVEFSHKNVRKGAKNWHWLKTRYVEHFKKSGFDGREAVEGLVLDFHCAFEAATTLHNAMKYPKFREAFEEAGYCGALVPIAAKKGFGESFR